MTMSNKPPPVNPYFYGGPIKDPCDFFGREEQLQTVLERLTKAGSTSVIGQRRSGKTSFLCYLMTAAAQSGSPFDAQGFVFVYMDPQLGMRGPEEFYRKLMETVAKQAPSAVPDAGSEVDGDQVQSMLEQLAPRHLVLLLDEFQTITSVGNFSEDFYRFLRGLSQDQGHEVCFITATMENLYDCCPPEMVSSPFPNIFAAVHLGSWMGSELDHFLAETSRRSEAPIQAYKDEICRLSGRFPFYVQIACSFYFDVWRKRREIGPQDQMDIKHRFAEEARPHFERMWKSYLTPSEKVVLVTLAHGKKPADHLTLRSLTQKGYVMDDRIFSSALTDFVLRQEAEGEVLPSVLAGTPRGPVAKGIWVDKKAGEVWVDGKPIPPLTKLEYKLLLCLYDSANRICDKYEIVEAVWSGDYVDEVDDSRIAKLVSRLRESVEPDPANCRYLLTVHGRGYRLVAEGA